MKLLIGFLEKLRIRDFLKVIFLPKKLVFTKHFFNSLAFLKVNKLISHFKKYNVTISCPLKFLTHPPPVCTGPWPLPPLVFITKYWGIDIPKNNANPIMYIFLIELLFVNWINVTPTAAIQKKRNKFVRTFLFLKRNAKWKGKKLRTHLQGHRGHSKWLRILEEELMRRRLRIFLRKNNEI